MLGQNRAETAGGGAPGFRRRVLGPRFPARARTASRATQCASYARLVDGELPKAEFGFPGPLRDKLVAAILRGDKTSTTGLFEHYQLEGETPGPVGKRMLVIDSDGRGVAVIEITESEVKPMGEVDLAFAIDEGEGFETVDEWRDAHIRFFTSPEMEHPPATIDDDTLVVCTRFRVVKQDRLAGGF